VKKLFTTTTVAILFLLLFGGWGGDGHKIINRNIYVCLPTTMGLPAYWSDTLYAHCSDADNRKSKDKTESPRHFIDIDAYLEFVTNGFILQDYNAFVALHGSSTVINNGTLPWAIVTWEDSLKRTFQQKNWHMAMQLAADLGHYVGDGHQPLHITENYDGDMSNQSGVHSRYETSLVKGYMSSIVYTNDTASYVSNVSDYAFNFIYNSYKTLDTCLYGDSVAAKVAGSTSGSVYLAKYWEIAGFDMIKLMKDGSKAAADLIYTAWVDAGRPDQSLPVQLVSFTGNQVGNNVSLKWNTATELNNLGFNIERSADKLNWNTITFIPGSGNSNSIKQYSYLDKSLSGGGKYYYRLKQTDVNGEYKYSDIIELIYTHPNTFNLEQNYPNPFNPDTKIKYSLPFESSIKVTIYNSLGETVKTLLDKVESAGSHEIRFNASELSSGIYIYTLQANSSDGKQTFRSTKKMSLLK
jgi:hypothetical protein